MITSCMEKKYKKWWNRSKFWVLTLVMCLMSGSVLVYADYQYGVDWREPQTTTVKGEYCDHNVTFWVKDFLNGSQLIKSSTKHSKYSVDNYTRLQYTRYGVVQIETKRCYADDGYNSYAEISERSEGGGYFGSRRIFCGTEGY